MADEMSQEELQERLKQMSPEQLRQFQKQQCIFCHIIAGKVASKKIYEDEKVLAVLDINPANPGHILLLPKEHYAILPQLPDEDIAHVSQIAKQLSKAVIKALKVEGTSIFAANGVAAGQRASHFMLHVIPRAEEDGVGLFLPEGSLSEKDTALLLSRLRPVIAKVLGVEEIKGGEKATDVPKHEKKAEKPGKETSGTAHEKASLDDLAGFLLK